MDNENTPPQNPASSAVPVVPEMADFDVSAGFWLRAGAYMIDGIVIVLASLLPIYILPEGARAIAQLLIAAAYFTAMPPSFGGQTSGKMAAGVKIVRNDGAPLTYGRALGRWASYLLSNLTLCLGFVCAAFTPHKRALHDYVAGTRVVRVEELGAGRKFLVIAMGVLFPLLAVLGIAAAVAIPQFSSAKTAADEANVRTRLGILRTATAIYSADMNGAYPADLNALVPKYTPEIAPAAVPGAPSAAGVETYGAEVCSGSKEPGQELVAAKLRGTGKWGYVAAPKAPCDGHVFVDSAQADRKGTAWYTY